MLSSPILRKDHPGFIALRKLLSSIWLACSTFIYKLQLIVFYPYVYSGIA